MKNLQRAISLVLAVLMVFGTAISLAAPEDGDLNREFNLTNDKLVEILVEGSLKAELEQPIINPLVKSDLNGASLDLFWQVEEDDIWRKALDGEVFEEGKDYRLAVNVRDLKIQDKEIEGLRLVSENNSDQVILSIDRERFSEKEELNFDEENAKDTDRTETTETIEETEEEVKELQEPKDELIFETETEDLEDKVDDQVDLNTDFNSDENQGEENKEEESSETIDLLVSDDKTEDDSATEEEPIISEETTDENLIDKNESEIVDEKPIEIIDDQKQGEEEEIIEISPEKEADREASPKAESTVSFTAYSAPMRAGGNGEGVYLNGVSGDDNKDGTSKENAVKTFARAKELAEEKSSDIIVVGTVTINDTQELSLKEGLRVLRGESFNKYLFEITGSNANVTLTNITIDGDSDKNKEIVESLIKVTSGATLNIKDGAILRNNVIKDITNTATRGGALHVSDSTLNMSGGKVEECQATYGGGIYLEGSTMNFTGGTVQNNESKRVIDKGYGGQIYSAGGGICAYNGSTINMSGSALVKGNKADEVGGGISLGSSQWGPGNTLHMDGGTIDSNESGATGGGIFIQAKYFSGGISRAYINAGYITNNIMLDTGKTDKVFGGAGIYVNGANKAQGANGENGELYLKNAIITGNTSYGEGAGLAVCPISKTKIYVRDGAAIYENYMINDPNTQTSIKSQRDFYLLSDTKYNNGLHAGEPQLEISDKMLGGFPYQWKELDGTDADLTNYNGKIADETRIKLYAGNSMPDDAEKALGKVIISGNHSATRGGGIGSNGTVIIGTDEKKIDILVEKQWEDGIDPEEVKVEVGIKLDDKNSYVLKTLTLNKENGYQEWVKGLPATIHDKDTKELIYVKELSNKYNVEVSPMTYVPNGKKLSFSLRRPEFTDYDNMIYAYTNYYMNYPDLGIFDREEWALNKFDIKFKLHDLNGKITERKISYDPDWYGFPTTEMKFDNIGLDPNFDKIDIQLYTKEDGTLFESYLLEYDLYLEKDENREDTLILKVPRIAPSMENPPEGKLTSLEIKNQKIEDENPGTKSYKITVTNKKKDTPELEISGTKTWSDFGAENRPEFITVRLFANDVEVAVKEVRASDDWKYDFGKWPAVDGDGKEISYTIKEDPVPGYYTTINGFDIINSREPYEPTPEYVNIRVNKRWIDNDNRNNTRPGSITIELLADGRVVDRATINSANDWGLTFFNMPKYDGGHLIDYTIREVPVEGYRSILTGDMHYGFTLTNELKGEKINIPVRKVWEGKKGAFANVSLYADGEIVYTVSLSDENNWEYIFEDLDRYDANGREIVYTIVEASIEGYESRIEGDQDRGFVVTNKSKESPKISIPLKKNWVGKKAEKAIVNLYANGVIVYTVDLSEENAWSFVFEDLDKLDQNGNEIIYSVEEVNIDGYQASLSGSAAEGFVITNTWILDRPDEDTPGKPNKPKKPELPKTGDGLNKSVYAAMVAIFGGVMVLLGLNEMRRAKRVYEEEKQ